ncbi:twin-arginine translocation signal domain-containing protein [Bdellovibrio sp. HCB274]|uniref:twin-arginine translocation signal domain-containing protein n=1 Tax=Bdellovibrio sp. HCB274 TaxID=3394361 RepID=UPI0039B5925F
MNRRHFLKGAALTGAALTMSKNVLAAELPVATGEACLIRMDQVTAEATYFARYEHFHILAIPLSVLIKPSDNGYTTRTSPLDQASSDEKAFNEFIKETGLDGGSLRTHSHSVTFTKNELERIADGEKEVKITVMTPKGNLAHHFYFTASRSALIKIKRGRGDNQI